MKKLVFMAVAAIALTATVSFVSCNGAAPAADTTAVEECCDSIEECCDSIAEAVDSVAEAVDSIAE